MNVTDVVFATDFSDVAETAAAVAREYARRLDARLHIFHVLGRDERDVTPLLATLSAAAAPTPVTVASTVGDPAAEIVRYAARVGAGLIVLGTHGRTGLSRALLGSVAERVTRTAPCPVLAVPHIGQAPQPEPATTIEPAPHCVVCGAVSADLICEPCRAVIRGEAVRRKLDDERAGRRASERIGR